MGVGSSICLKSAQTDRWRKRERASLSLKKLNSTKEYDKIASHTRHRICKWRLTNCCHATHARRAWSASHTENPMRGWSAIGALLTFVQRLTAASAKWSLAGPASLTFPTETAQTTSNPNLKHYRNYPLNSLKCTSWRLAQSTITNFRGRGNYYGSNQRNIVSKGKYKPKLRSTKITVKTFCW